MFPVLERKGDHSLLRMVESRTLYVRAKESVLMAPSALSIKKAIRRIPPVFLGEHTDLPFDVKA